MSLESCLDKLALIERNAPSKDAAGSPQAAWATRLSSVPCSIWPASARVVANFAALDSVAEFEMVTATDVGCTTQDRVTINSKVYAVIGYQPFGNASFGSETPFVTVLGKRNQP